MHHFPTAATYEIFRRPADAYMLGHSRIGEAVRKAGLFAASDSSFMLQNTGSDITRAMNVHMMAAFPSANFHFVSAISEVSTEHFVTQPLHPINGLIRVPEQPGLGVELDMNQVQRLEQIEPMVKPRFIIVCKYDNGATLYTRPDPENPHFMVRPDWSRTLMPMSFVAPLNTEYWDDDEDRGGGGSPGGTLRRSVAGVTPAVHPSRDWPSHHMILFSCSFSTHYCTCIYKCRRHYGGAVDQQ